MNNRFGVGEASGSSPPSSATAKFSRVEWTNSKVAPEAPSAIITRESGNREIQTSRGAGFSSASSSANISVSSVFAVFSKGICSSDPLKMSLRVVSLA
jgi:hypothetical protein